MFDDVQKELNELVEIVHQAALVVAGMALDPNGKRSPEAMQEYARKESRKTYLMEKYNLTENVAYRQRKSVVG